VVAAWQQIAKVSGGPRVVSVRAGNVIGGGDFAENRIIPDLIRGVMSGTAVEIRNPESTRPWQHVLDPCKGYLMALENALINNGPSHLNFGPTDESLTVREVAEISLQVFPSLKLFVQEKNSSEVKESMNLDLNSARSIEHLKWNPSFDQRQAIESTFIWWRTTIDSTVVIKELCLQDIKRILEIKN